MKSPIVLLVEQQKRRKILKRRRNRMLRQSWTVGSRRKKENAVERSGENIRTDSAEEALPYELVIVEAEKK